MIFQDIIFIYCICIPLFPRAGSLCVAFSVKLKCCSGWHTYKSESTYKSKNEQKSEIFESWWGCLLMTPKTGLFFLSLSLSRCAFVIPLFIILLTACWLFYSFFKPRVCFVKGRTYKHPYHRNLRSQSFIVSISAQSPMVLHRPWSRE